MVRLKKLKEEIDKQVQTSIERMEQMVSDTREVLRSDTKGKLGIRIQHTRSGAQVRWYLRHLKWAEEKWQVRSEYLRKNKTTDMYSPKSIIGRVHKEEFEVFCEVEPELCRERTIIKECNKMLRKIDSIERSIETRPAINPDREWQEHQKRKALRAERKRNEQQAVG